MKKTLAIILLVVIVISFAACGKNKNNDIYFTNTWKSMGDKFLCFSGIFYF